MRDVNKRSLNLLRKTKVFFLRHLHKKGQLFYRDIVWCQNIKKKCACIHSDNGSRKIPTQKTPSLKNLHPLGKPSPHHPPPPPQKNFDNVCNIYSTDHFLWILFFLKKNSIECIGSLVNYLFSIHLYRGTS